MRIMKACRGVNPYISPPHASYLLQVDEFNRKRAAGDERDHAGKRSGPASGRVEHSGDSPPPAIACSQNGGRDGGLSVPLLS